MKTGYEIKIIAMLCTVRDEQMDLKFLQNLSLNFDRFSSFSYVHFPNFNRKKTPIGYLLAIVLVGSSTFSIVFRFERCLLFSFTSFSF